MMGLARIFIGISFSVQYTMNILLAILCTIELIPKEQLKINRRGRGLRLPKYQSRSPSGSSVKCLTYETVRHKPVRAAFSFKRTELNTKNEPKRRQCLPFVFVFCVPLILRQTHALNNILEKIKYYLFEFSTIEPYCRPK